MCACIACVCYGMHVQGRGQLVGIGSFLLPCRSPESNSGPPTWQVTDLLTISLTLTLLYIVVKLTGQSSQKTLKGNFDSYGGVFVINNQST